MRSCLLISQAFFALLIGLQEQFAIADTRLRNLEIQQCTESDLVTWNDGRDQPTGAKSFNFFYVHKGAPSWFTEQQVKERLQRAATEWSRCGIPTAVDNSKTTLRTGENDVIVYWDNRVEVGFGLADLTSRKLALGIQAFHLLAKRNPSHDQFETLQMVLSHEAGHFYGLVAHSRRCIDTLSYYHDNKGNKCFFRYPNLLTSFPEYRSSLPTACDILRCQKLNGFR